MVIIDEMTSAFWGVTLTEGKRYTQKLRGAVHVSMAALEPGTNKGVNEPVSVMIQHENVDFMLCSLSSAGSVLQQTLDLNFNKGEEVTFYLKGKGVVHLTGYVLTGEDYNSGSDEDFLPASSSEESDENSDSDEDDMLGDSKKRKKHLADTKSKKPKVEIVDEDDEEEEEEDDDSSEVDDSDEESDDRRYELIDDEAEEDISFRESDDERSEETEAEGAKLSAVQLILDPQTEEYKSDMGDDDDDEEQTPNQKKSEQKKHGKAKQDQSPLSQQPKKDKKDKINQKAIESSTAPKEPANQSVSSETGEKKKKKKRKNKKKNQASENAAKADAGPSTEREGSSKPSSKVVEGVTIEDLKVGHGPEAKTGSTVHVYYTGRLTNGKMFDSRNSGKPMKIKLGKKQVIKGWEVGIQGMKVGGRRKLVIPPAMGYGPQNLGTIPPNSTLQFEVELKAVN